MMRLFFRLLCLLFTLSWLSPALATQLQLKLKLFATTSAYLGGTISGYKVAEYSFPSTLSSNNFFSSISRNVAYTPPAPDTYYYSLILTETTSSGEKSSIIRLFQQQ